uniref:Peptidase S1 domain-containing protein n=1 Tax=Anopheles epiroticus TaxID=199890 RepID=A0A182PBX2_9DIPT
KAFYDISSLYANNGIPKLDVFIRLSKFADWITEIMRKEGEEVSFDPLVCAKRHLEYRRPINNINTKLFEPIKTIDYMVSIQANPGKIEAPECAGVLIRKDIVVTLAQCASDLIVVFTDQSSISIRDIFIHPNYTTNSLYDNIAILKLVSSSSSTTANVSNSFNNDG